MRCRDASRAAHDAPFAVRRLGDLQGAHAALRLIGGDGDHSTRRPRARQRRRFEVLAEQVLTGAAHPAASGRARLPAAARRTTRPRATARRSAVTGLGVPAGRGTAAGRGTPAGRDVAARGQASPRGSRAARVRSGVAAPGGSRRTLRAVRRFLGTAGQQQCQGHAVYGAPRQMGVDGVHRGVWSQKTSSVPDRAQFSCGSPQIAGTRFFCALPAGPWTSMMRLAHGAHPTHNCRTAPRAELARARAHERRRGPQALGPSGRASPAAIVDVTALDG